MDKHFIKNIDFESILEMESLVSYQSGQVVSRTLAQNEALSLTLFAFDKGEQISSHTSSGDAMIYVLDGSAQITIGSKTYDLDKGKTIVMPAGIYHAVSAIEKFKMFLIVVF